MKYKLMVIIIILGLIVFIKNKDFLGIIDYKNNILNNFDISEENKYLILINKENSLDNNYIPDDLVKPNIRFLKNTDDEAKLMDKEVATALENLFECAKSKGITLIGSSAYRSYKSQVRIFKESIKENGKNYAEKYVAIPGQSEHQSGLAVDVTNEARAMGKESIEAKWLSENSYKFGFILRYPEGKEDITGYNYEPWHIRYVGEDVAKYIYENDLTLEEYLGENK
jgi:D-alanyl-D-alanine carboxypeptidase